MMLGFAGAGELTTGGDGDGVWLDWGEAGFAGFEGKGIGV
jgi:hypothetical protein